MAKDNKDETTTTITKSPLDSAANKLREAFNKEWQGKLDIKLKATLDAGTVATNANKAFEAAKEDLTVLVDDYEKAKAEFNSLVKSVA